MIGSLVRYVIAALGFGAVAYVGFNELLQWVTSEIHGQLNGLPSLAVNFMGLAKVDLAINIILSAYAMNVGLMILNRFARR
jgi:hypothetical protein